MARPRGRPGDLFSANNLSDVANAATARSNLGARAEADGLDEIEGFSPTTGQIIRRTAVGWATEAYSKRPRWDYHLGDLVGAGWDDATSYDSGSGGTTALESLNIPVDGESPWDDTTRIVLKAPDHETNALYSGALRQISGAAWWAALGVDVYRRGKSREFGNALWVYGTMVDGTSIDNTNNHHGGGLVHAGTNPQNNHFRVGTGVPFGTETGGTTTEWRSSSFNIGFAKVGTDLTLWSCHNGEGWEQAHPTAITISGGDALIGIRIITGLGLTGCNVVVAARFRQFTKDPFALA